MRYLITTKDHDPFLTKWFDPENHFYCDVDMIVYDLETKKYTIDGVNWIDLLIDHL